MSGEYYRLLWRRAERFLLRAVRDYEEGDYDGACFNAEEVMQLAVEAVLYRYFGETPRIHGLRALLARLGNFLMGAGRDDVAALVGRFASDYRDALDILEGSYTMARYGEVSYGGRQGRLCVDTARKALEVPWGCRGGAGLG
ncbi:MAG: HEPN domain-containing protein, partial [Desulfurococcales archaeon]|nr:HEPN domain-containing protein [Desulfurococcales archaeon]